MKRSYESVPKRAKNSIQKQAEKLVNKYGETEVWLVLRKYFEARKERKSAEKQKVELEQQLIKLKKEYKIQTGVEGKL